MNIICCVKQVPDTETKIEVEDGAIVEKGINWIVNPYDEFAVEEAIQIKEKMGEGTVHIISMGPERAQEAIKSCLALGCEEATHLCDPVFDGSDSMATAKALAAAIEKIPFDLILCGKQGVDLDCMQVPVILADLLGLPHASVVTNLEISDDGKTATVQREIEGGKAVMELSLPAVITCQKGLNEPRYATLKGIMSVKRKKIEATEAASIGVDVSTVGADGSSTSVKEVSLPPERSAGKLVEGETPQEQAANLAKLLREEAKVL